MKRTYLIAYNLALALGWGIFLVRETINGFTMDSTSLWLLNFTQGAAILEIAHVALTWVKSPLFTTFIQVFSRIFVLIFINIIPSQELIKLYSISGVVLVTVAWGITEVVRYSYYFFSLLKQEITWLTFLRYTLFIVLYPIGVAGEWLILLSMMRMSGWEVNALNIFLAIVLLLYIPFFPKLYLYMWKQRAKKV